MNIYLLFFPIFSFFSLFTTLYMRNGMEIGCPDWFNARNASKLNNLSIFSRTYAWLRFILSFSSPPPPPPLLLLRHIHKDLFRARSLSFSRLPLATQTIWHEAEFPTHTHRCQLVAATIRRWVAFLLMVLICIRFSTRQPLLAGSLFLRCKCEFTLFRKLVSILHWMLRTRISAT